MTENENVIDSWLARTFSEVSPKAFYREIFPEGELEKKGEQVRGKYTGIAISVKIDPDEKERLGSGYRPQVKRYTVTDDLDMIDELGRSEEFCLMSPLSYAGRHRFAASSRFMYAMAVDVDRLIFHGDRPSGLIALWEGHICKVKRVPQPTFIVSSGTGVHLYYVFERPVPMFPNIVRQLQLLKRAVTFLIWNEGVVDIKDERDVQQEGIFQGFRIPGTVTKIGSRVRAFKCGGKVSIEYMNQFVLAKERVTEFTYKSRMTLAEAKEKYPEWYEERIVQKKKGVVRPWHVSRNVYDWWKREIIRKAKVGHRYYCLMALAIYAKKCSIEDVKHNPNPVTYDELEKDCFELMDIFEALTDDPQNHFTEADVLDALEAFNERYYSYPRGSIAWKAGIVIEANKRNRRKQKDHVKIMNFVRDEINQNTSWRDGNGRPSKEQMVKEWRALHPDGRKADCIRELKLSKPTVYRWWGD